MAGMHVYFDDALKEKLERFTENRRNGGGGPSQSKIIRDALERLFAVEPEDPEKSRRLAEAVSHYFKIPTGYELRSFWLTLWVLSRAYPQASSKKFWGEMVYIAEENLSHREVVERITKERQDGAEIHDNRN